MGVPLYVLEDKLLELLTEKKKLRKILAQNSAKEEGSWGQVLSQTNWKIWILSQKNQKIFIGGGPPSIVFWFILILRQLYLYAILALYFTLYIKFFHSLCASSCGSGYYVEDPTDSHRTCQKCDRSCSSCDGDGARSCTSCGSGFYLDTSSHSCVEECPSDYYPGRCIINNYVLSSLHHKQYAKV